MRQPQSPEATVSDLQSQLRQCVSDDLSVDECGRILKELAEVDMNIELLTSTKVGKDLAALAKEEELSTLHKDANALLKKWKALVRKPSDSASEESKPKKKAKLSSVPESGTAEPLHSTVKGYRELLVEQKKEMYKDPPAMPPCTVEILPAAKPMSRHKLGHLVAEGHPRFKPNLTPAEVLQRGSFGGTYFRAIKSAVTGESYKAKDVTIEYPEEWFKGLDMKHLVWSQDYNPKVNRYGVKCGGSLGMWESSGWISALDPYGWFQWYCRFYQGRRCTDDERQIDRWLKGHGPKGRFRAQLLNKIIAARTDVDDVKISPVIRQTCQHWGYVPTQQDLDAHKKAKGL